MASEMILAKLSQLQGFGEKFIAKMGEVSERVRTLEAVGAQANLIERILVNGDPLSVGENKTVNIPVPTRVNQLENDASYQENVIERIQVNGVTQGITGKTVNVHMPTAVSELTNDENYQTNVLEGVKVNGTALTIDAEKNVNVSVPTKVSQLTNDKTYQTKTEVENTVKTAVAGKSATGHKHLWADITNKPSTFAPSAHKHVKADISDFPTSMPASDVSTWAKAASKPSYGWSEITGKPSTFTPSSHTHGQYYDSGVSRSANTVLAAPDGKTGGATFRKLGLADIPNASDLINALTCGDASPVDNDLIVTQWANHETADASNQNTYVRRPMSSIWGYIKSKADSVYQSKGNYAASSHTHTKSQITDFPTLGTAAAKNVGDFAAASHNHDTSYYKKSEIDAKLSGVAVSGHTHKKTDITDFPTSMPASDVKAWAKAANKPSYTKAEVGLGSVDNTADSAKDVSSAGRIRNDSRQTALSGTASPTTGLTVYQVYNNGYPVPYGNVISVMGNGAGQILAAWSGASGAVARLYYRNKRDTSDANWSAWKTLAFTDDKPATAGTADTAKSVAWDNVTGKPSTFTPATHSHAWGDVTGKPTTFAPSSHNHDDRYYTESEMDTKLSGKANSSHTHNYAGSSSAGGTAASVNGFTFGVQTSDPGANSSLTTNKFLFVYE